MNCFFFFLFAAFGIATAIVAWRKLSSRLQETRTELDDLKIDLYALRRTVESRLDQPQPRISAAEPEQTPALPLAAAPTAPPIPVPTTTASPPPPEPPAVETKAGAEAQSPPQRPVAPEISPPSPPSRPSFSSVDWEQWVGVRGAAVLGGVVLALAALLFLKYSIEHGLIPPIVRVIAGVIAGVGAIWGSEVLRRRDYETTANSLAGSGVVILYAAFWAANQLYGLIPTAPAFGLMILVTVACGMLAWRHQSLVIAVLGLAGGFATPLLLAATQDNPIGLFVYILLLDVGLLTLARKRRWPILGALGLLATFFHQALWIFFEMEPGSLWLGLFILAAFAALFAWMAPGTKSDSSLTHTRIWRSTQIASILMPFLFALYFAGQADLGEHLWPIACLLFLMSLAAAWIARAQRVPAIAISAAAATVAVVLVWISRTRFDSALSWEVVTIAVALALAFHIFDELDLRSGRDLAEPTPRFGASLVATGGFFVLLLGASLTKVPSLWPWLVGWSVLTSLLLRQSLLPHLAYRQVLAAGLLGSGFALYFDVHRTTLALPPPALYFGLVLAAAVVFQLLVDKQGDTATKRSAEFAAALLPGIVLVGLVSESTQPTLAAGLYYLTTIILALLLVLIGTRLSEGRIVFATMAVLALEHFLWTLNQFDLTSEPERAMLAMAAQLAAVILFVIWPFLTSARFVGDRWVWYAAALAPPAWFLSLKQLFEARFGDSALGLLPLALGALSLGAAYKLRHTFRTDDPQRKSNLAWFAAVALGFLSVAIPLQLDKEWITIGWALEGVAVLILWKHLDHPGLKYFGLALLAAVTVRLIANPALLVYHPRTGWPVFNWLMYTYLVPAVALLGSGAVLRQLEIERLLEWERPVYSRGYPLAAIGCTVAAILVVFVWINLTIFDAFSPGLELAINFDRLPARDLTLSLAWAVYALILLAVGMAQRSQGLRWISLAFIFLTIGKVFLYDLGELKDLYRVASLMGLAISLILVSLAYQRFVFRQHPEEREE